MAKPTTFRPGDKGDCEKNCVLYSAHAVMTAVSVEHKNTSGETGYGDTGACRTARKDLITAWAETCSYRHCCCPPGLQQWCNGRMVCHQIHPPGDLGEREERMRATCRTAQSPDGKTEDSPFSVSVTWFSHSSYLASSWDENRQLWPFGYWQKHQNRDYWHISDWTPQIL